MKDSKSNKAVAIFIIVNEKGLHTRPSTELVKCASSFSSHVQLYFRQYVVNAKSLLGILMLAAGKGSKIKVEAIGSDSQQAVDTIIRLAENKFNMRY
jgi:phosphocarrier protein HPr